MDLQEAIEEPYLKDDIPHFQIGDTLEVKFRIREGEKERMQAFTGTLIRRRGSGVRETITVRRIVDGEGVERIFPLHSPKIGEINALRHGRVRRAKLYYLRDRVGKATRVREELFRDTEKAASTVKKRKRAAKPAPAAASPSTEEKAEGGDA